MKLQFKAEFWPNAAKRDCLDPVIQMRVLKNNRLQFEKT